MEIKAKFGKYKAKDVDAYIALLKGEQESVRKDFEQKIQALEAERAELLKKLAKLEEKEGVIAEVMINATQHAKEIEDDYRKRAEQSDAACKKLNDEWINGMQSAQANLQALRGEVKNVLEQIDSQFASLCSWADNRLESLENAQLPQANEQTIEQEIIAGANTDLGEVCKEMGFAEEETEVEENVNQVEAEEVNE